MSSYALDMKDKSLSKTKRESFSWIQWEDIRNPKELKALGAGSGITRKDL
jgi:hypothetical protein